MFGQEYKFVLMNHKLLQFGIDCIDHRSSSIRFGRHIYATIVNKLGTIGIVPHMTEDLNHKFDRWGRLCKHH